VHAIQIELSRRLYMNELTLERKARDFEQLRGFCRELVARLSVVRPRASAGPQAQSELGS
jgi:N-formylglutamate amidohydrolase